MINLQGINAPADDGHPLYARVSHLGQGSYGNVWLAHRRSDGAQVALKYVDANDDMRMTIMREICNHLKLIHPHIVHLRHVSHHAGSIVLELEALPGGDLCRLMNDHFFNTGMPENVARWYFQQIVLAVDYCHAKLVCNRDLKLENVVLGAPSVGSGNFHPQAKLCDFGWSKDEGGDSAPHTRAGSPAYVAPEILAGGGVAAYDGAAADAWSLGVILYCLLVGRQPFVRPEDTKLKSEVAKMQALTSRILAGDYDFPDTPVISAGARDLIKRLLEMDPERRLRVDAILQHAWTFEGDDAARVAAVRGYNAGQLAKEADPRMAARMAAKMATADAVFRALGWELPAGLG